MNYSLLESNLPPLIIKKEVKNEYMQLLGEAQTKEFPDPQDIEKIVAFVKPIMEEEEKRMLSFANKESKQVKTINETKEEERRINLMNKKFNNGEQR